MKVRSQRSTISRLTYMLKENTMFQNYLLDVTTSKKNSEELKVKSSLTLTLLTTSTKQLIGFICLKFQTKLQTIKSQSSMIIKRLITGYLTKMQKIPNTTLSKEEVRILYFSVFQYLCIDCFLIRFHYPTPTRYSHPVNALLMGFKRPLKLDMVAHQPRLPHHFSYYLSRTQTHS